MLSFWPVMKLMSEFIVMIRMDNFPSGMVVYLMEAINVITFSEYYFFSNAKTHFSFPLLKPLKSRYVLELMHLGQLAVFVVFFPRIVYYFLFLVIV